ncbi:hypothetical protein M9H77_20774 [Catharanthus roseus]|uniref:Uncharacterized protein n=1 Tax=Catharanthus roseus TaxID=4058 RepID=A0ACC0AL60_CATRO|nr:hypothetical protein M9H77_20774 [Catharanthus roseus]
MGHRSSKEKMESSDDSSHGAKSSRVERLKQRLHLHRHKNRQGSGSPPKLLKEEDFAGIALIRIINEKKLLLERNGAHIARLSVFETNRLSRNNLIGYCEIDLLEFLTQDGDSDVGTFELLDPSSKVVVGTLTISCTIEDPMETEKNFARRILSIVDYNEDGKLSLDEFSDLIDAFGNQLAANKKEELFKTADENGDGVVSIDELAVLLAFQQENKRTYRCDMARKVSGLSNSRDGQAVLPMSPLFN